MADELKVGFGKTDITPRVGVELAGYGAFLNRHSIAVRDRLWARAMAVSAGGETVILASCDLVGINPGIAGKARRIFEAKTGLEGGRVMICCTHTHSGPGTGSSRGWGDGDEPYIELLPRRIASACAEAAAGMEEASIGYAEVPCEGIGVNRVYEKTPLAEDALRDDWRPEKPELTDVACKVFTVESGGLLKGFISSFGCHPVVCRQQCRHIHGDYAGVATNIIETEFPGSTGLFLQGASGDVNACAICRLEQPPFRELDVIAGRFAGSVREGIRRAGRTSIAEIGAISRKAAFSSRKVSIDSLRQKLAECEKIVEQENISDSDKDLRRAVLFIPGLIKFIDALDSGREEDLNPPAELQLLKLGPITFFGAPFEVFQAVKNDIVRAAESEVPVLVSHANASLGYAPSNDKIGSGCYEDSFVPVVKQQLPRADIHNELVSNLLDMEKCLLKNR